MAKSTFNLQATNTGFGGRAGGPHGPHFPLTNADEAKMTVRDRAHSSAPTAAGSARPFRAMSLTLTIATLLVAAFWISRPWQRQSLAHRWRQDLHEADDALALARVHQLGQLGPPGVRVLGGAVGIAREDVARAARAEVTSLMTQWELIDAKRSSPLIVALAQGMAESIEVFDREARRFAGDTAQRILVWPVDRNTTNRAPLIAACETVLVSVGRPAAPTPAAQPTPTDEPSPAEARLLPSSIEVTPLARVPAEATVEVSDGPASEPPSPTDAEPTESLPSQEESQSAPRELSPTVARQERTVSEIDDRNGGEPAGFTSQQATWIRDLNSEQEAVATQARAELAKLGLSASELEIARLSTHPDAAVRKRLARALPRMSGIDARTWLEFLADDPDDEVRRTAQTLLATTGDAASMSRLRERH